MPRMVQLITPYAVSSQAGYLSSTGLLSAAILVWCMLTPGVALGKSRWSARRSRLVLRIVSDCLS